MLSLKGRTIIFGGGDKKKFWNTNDFFSVLLSVQTIFFQLHHSANNFFHPVISPSEAYINNHKMHQVQSKPKGIFVDLGVSSHYTPGRSHRIEFQVDSGCSCNTMHY